MQKEKLEKLAGEKNVPCVTVSLNTHRTHPDNTQDVILLKKLLKEARERVVSEFGKRDVANILEKIENIEKNVDVNYNLDSMHIFVSGETAEVIRSSLSVPGNIVQVSDSFAIKPLIKMLNNTEEYLILLLSKSDARLYHSVNDTVLSEIRNDDFPFQHNYDFATDGITSSDAIKTDNLLRDYLNKVDKAVQKVNNETGLNCVVISALENYSHLKEVLDRPSIYLGHAFTDYNNVKPQQLAVQAWEIVNKHLKNLRGEAVKEMQNAVGASLVATDISEIYRAAKEGRGELLIVNSAFKQTAKINGPSIQLTSAGDTEAIDLISELAWIVASKKGRVIFTADDELDSLGDIALKLRY